MKKTALIIGATGLVGKELTRLLVEDDEFSEVRVFLRSSTGIKNPKLREIKTDFDHPEKVMAYIRGEVLFSCMGTTRKQAGSKEKQYKIDYTYQYNFARIASENNVQDYILISSPGASPKSKIFYSRMKGELDEAVRKLPFRRHIFIQPSVLKGDRPESRPGEKWGGKIIDTLSAILPPLKKYRSITGKQVARAMLRIYQNPDAEGIFSLDELHEQNGE